MRVNRRHGSIGGPCSLGVIFKEVGENRPNQKLNIVAYFKEAV